MEELSVTANVNKHKKPTPRTRAVWNVWRKWLLCVVFGISKAISLIKKENGRTPVLLLLAISSPYRTIIADFYLFVQQGKSLFSLASKVLEDNLVQNNPHLLFHNDPLIS